MKWTDKFGLGDTSELRIDWMSYRDLLCRCGFEALSQIAQLACLVGREPYPQFGRLRKHVSHSAPGDVDRQRRIALEFQRNAESVRECRLVLEFDAGHLA